MKQRWFTRDGCLHSSVMTKLLCCSLSSTGSVVRQPRRVRTGGGRSRSPKSHDGNVHFAP